MFTLEFDRDETVAIIELLAGINPDILIVKDAELGRALKRACAKSKALSEYQRVTGDGEFSVTIQGDFE